MISPCQNRRTYLLLGFTLRERRLGYSAAWVYMGRGMNDCILTKNFAYLTLDSHWTEKHREDLHVVGGLI